MIQDFSLPLLDLDKLDSQIAHLTLQILSIVDAGEL